MSQDVGSKIRAIKGLEGSVATKQAEILQARKQAASESLSLALERLDQIQVDGSVLLKTKIVEVLKECKSLSSSHPYAAELAGNLLKKWFLLK